MKSVISTTALIAAFSAPALAQEGQGTDMKQLFEQAAKYNRSAAEEAINYRDLLLNFSPPSDRSQYDILKSIVNRWDLSFDPLKTQIATYDFDHDGDEDIFLQFQNESMIAVFERNEDNTIKKAGMIKAESIMRGLQQNKLTAMTSGNQRYSYIYDGSRFVFDYESIGEKIPLFEASMSEVEGILSRDLKTRFLVMQSSSAKDDKILFGEVDLNGDGNKEKILSVRCASICANNMACPVFLYTDYNDQPFYTTWSQSEDVYVEPEAGPGKLKNIYFEYENMPHVATWSREQSEYELYELF